MKIFILQKMCIRDRAKGTGVTPELETIMNKTVKKVSSDIEDMKFNTAVAAMMTLVNEIYDKKKLTVDELKTFVTMLCPFCLLYTSRDFRGACTANFGYQNAAGHLLCVPDA